ncbi:MAG: hypothetical protein KDM63_16205, partial [Verrucomicrobiae bacterium]|nr:hypothetical protein [Verrucomicrobiae bacterium]
DANFYHVADVEALPDVFQRELGELEQIIARKLVIEISFPDGIEPIEILGRPDAIQGRKGHISFGTLSAEQAREIFVTCRLNPSKAPKDAFALASAKLTYQDTTEAGTARDETIEAKATVKSVEDRDLANKAQVNEITAQAEIYRNADATRRAVALADEGKGAEAKAAIDSQIIRLQTAAASAPAPVAKQLAEEIEVLDRSKDELNEQGLSKEGRKALQWNVFQRSNSKPESGR